MKQYHKIQTIFKRDEKTKKIIVGDYSLPEFEYLKDNVWVFDEKVDGTNIRVMWNGSEVSYNGKSDNSQMPMKLITRLQEMFDNKKDVFSAIFHNEEPDLQVCLYGEGYGASIQSGGKYIPDGVDFVLFDVNINGIFMDRGFVEHVGAEFGIKVTPLVGEGTIAEAIEMVNTGYKSQWGDFLAEGLIIRPKVALYDRRGRRIITKIKHVDFKS